MERFKCPLAVHILFIKDNQLLLQLRQNSSFGGQYGVPGGHIDGNEKIISAAIREAKEEVGLTLTENDLSLGTICHSNFGGNEYIQFFYICKNNSQKPVNCEPEFCKELKFYDMENLPQNTLGILKTAIDAIKESKTFVEDDF